MWCWTHKNFRDVFVRVLKVRYQGPKYTKVKVEWWNNGFTGNPWPLGVKEQLTIMNNDLPNWKKETKVLNYGRLWDDL